MTGTSGDLLKSQPKSCLSNLENPSHFLRYSTYAYFLIELNIFNITVYYAKCLITEMVACKYCANRTPAKNVLMILHLLFFCERHAPTDELCDLDIRRLHISIYENYSLFPSERDTARPYP